MAGAEGEEYWNKRDGAWIFVSHSHLDFHRVRVVRNLLEERGHRPLMFFLKCMEDGSRELPDLIRREIEARTWFLLCESPRSRESAWVQAEIEMIQHREGGVFETVDLESPLAAQVERIDAISRRATVFLSHSQRDKAIANRLRGALEAADFDVVGPEDLAAGGNWQEGIARRIDYALDRGFVLTLVSRHALAPESFVRRETLYALGKQANRVIPVAVDDVDVRDLLLRFRELQVFDLTAGPFDERVRALVQYLKITPL